MGMSPKDACLDVLKRVARTTTTMRSGSTSSTSTSMRFARMASLQAPRSWNAVRRQRAWVSRQFVVADAGKARLETASICWSGNRLDELELDAFELGLGSIAAIYGDPEEE